MAKRPCTSFTKLWELCELLGTLVSLTRQMYVTVLIIKERANFNIPKSHGELWARWELWEQRDLRELLELQELWELR